MQFGKFEITKALVRDLGDAHKLHDMTSEISKSPNIPSLLTTVVDLQDEFLSGNVFEHDYVKTEITMPSGKAFHERGENFDQRKTVDTKLFKIGSAGIQSHIRPTDMKRTRKAGTADQLEVIETLINEDLAGMRRAFALKDERAIAHLITTGTSYVLNGNAPVYDFYQEYAGVAATSRPVVYFDLSNNAAYPMEAGEDARNLINDNLLDGQTIGGYIMLCGKEFFRKRVRHPKEEQAVVDRSGAMGQDPLQKRLANFSQQYRQYMGADDILYVQYTASVGGSPLIADEEAYLIPADTTGIIKRAFAPAETMQYVDTIAQREYAWRMDDEFTGVKLFMESNSGLFLVNPLSVVKCSSAASA